MKLVCWSRTDPGRKRDHNEDSFLVADELGLFAVADGMGGHQGGEQASRLALEVLKREISAAAGNYEAAWESVVEDTHRTLEIAASDTLDDSRDEELEPLPSPARTSREEGMQAPAGSLMAHAARKASSAVFAAALDEPSLRGMGTTLTAMLYHGGKMHLCHAGDSRGYLLRDGQLQQLTEDHSWIQEQINSGAMSEEEARESQFRHVITRSVGFERDVDVDSTGIAVESGDCFLLCSDGMSNYIDGDELARVMEKHWYRRLPEALIEMANDRGGDDNITVLVVYAANDAEP